jgi:hypothetical protein
MQYNHYLSSDYHINAHYTASHSIAVYTKEGALLSKLIHDIY